MNNSEILAKLNSIFKEVLDNQSIQLAESTTANDIEEWDSLSNIELIVAIEKEFRVRFNASEIEHWQNVGDMCRAISGKAVN
jgi:acyl carrier protein